MGRLTGVAPRVDWGSHVLPTFSGIDFSIHLNFIRKVNGGELLVFLQLLS